MDSLRTDCRANLSCIRELVTKIEAYFPKDLLFIADSRSMFDVPEMMTKFRDTMLKLDSLRPDNNRL